MDKKIEHLKMIQEIIVRMNTNSFQIKGWAISVVSALLALYVNSNIIDYIFIAIIPTIVFWILDAYYLQQERKYRALYNDIISLSGEDNDIEMFSMSIERYNTCQYCIFKAMLSLTLVPIYLILGLSMIFFGLIVK